MIYTVARIVTLGHPRNEPLSHVFCGVAGDSRQLPIFRELALTDTGVSPFEAFGDSLGISTSTCYDRGIRVLP